MTTQASQPKDSCPAWATSLITTLRELEIKLGNLHPESAWSEATVDAILSRVEKDPVALRFDENAVDEIFRRLSIGLSNEGHAPEIIATFINSRLTSGQTLAYCSPDEVREALAGR